MRLHANARLSVKGRELLVDRIENAGWSLAKANRGGGSRTSEDVLGRPGTLRESIYGQNCRRRS
jgi:hypothetical protein